MIVTDQLPQEDRVQADWEQSTWQDSVWGGTGDPVAWGEEYWTRCRLSEVLVYQAVCQWEGVAPPATVHCPAPDPLPTGQAPGQGAGGPGGGRPLGLGEGHSTHILIPNWATC